MRKPSNIVFLHGVNWWNVGDIAISLGMVAAFRRRFPRATLRCVSPYFAWRKPAGTADILPGLPILADPFCFPAIASWHSAGGKLIFLLGAVGRILGTLVFALSFRCVGWQPLWTVPRRYWPALRAYASADVLISKGGGFLHGRGNFGVSAHIFPLCFGLLLGKRVEVFAQSIGPFRGGLVGRISKKITMSLLRRCQRVSVREDESARLLAAEGISAERCPDAAIDLPSRAAPRREVAAMGRLARGGHPVIALTVYPLKNAAQRERYTRDLAALVAKLHRRGARFALFPHALAGGLEPPDTPLLRAAVARAGVPTTDYYAVQTPCPRQRIALLRRTRGMLGTRLHGCLLALCARIPVAAIGYLPKTAAILAQLAPNTPVCGVEDIPKDFEGKVAKAFGLG